MSSLRSQVARYTLLPQLWPRVAALFSSGFVHISYLIAVIYQAVNLLPADHPYLNPANKGRFGMRHVIAEAANNLVISRKNIDQVLIFFTILVGLVLLFLQFGLLIFAVVAQQPAMAANALNVPTEALNWKNLLAVDSVYGHGRNGGGPSQDLVFIILDRVFGLKDVYNSCVSTAASCLNLSGEALPAGLQYPTPFQKALHTMIEFYSRGMFFVASITIIYFFTTIVAETAMTGSPFGQRVNRAWAPIRLIVFFAMLLPITGENAKNPGFNGAQLVTFYVAKYGSNFATNGWGYFSNVIANTPAESMIATPIIPELGGLSQFVFVAQNCKILEEKSMASNSYTIQPYIVRPGTPQQDASGNPIAGATDDAIELMTANFDAAIAHAGGGNIIISFGHKAPGAAATQKYMGGVQPWCGQLVLPVKSQTASVRAVQKIYYEVVQTMWEDPDMIPQAKCLTEWGYNKENDPTCTLSLDSDFITSVMVKYQDMVDEIPFEIKQSIDDGDFVVRNPNPNAPASASQSVLGIPANLNAKGWGGAALWYNRIAEMNGAVVDAVYSLPQGTQYPIVMETVAKNRAQTDASVSNQNRFEPSLANNEKINYVRPDIDTYIAPVLYEAYKSWNAEELQKTPSTSDTGNLFIDMINLIMGTSGVFDMYENTNIHPLAQLSSLGKSMMFASMRNIGAGISAELLTNLLEEKSISKQLAATLGKFAKTMGFAMLALSFVLYYVLPFLPFIYFLFAVSGWVKSIFEAIVAMPLWAMAHIRIDGEGLPGGDASNGYFLLLEIFLRPILIVFGLIASISLFSAMVQGLNEVFDIVVSNVSGFNMKEAMQEATNQVDFDRLSSSMRGSIDQLFYTVMYVIICYMIGLSSFKLIDAIPNQILRWTGVSVATIQEGAGDPAGQLSQKTFTGTTLLTGRVDGGTLAALL